MRRAPNERSSIDVKLANINLSTYSDVRTGSQDLTSVDRENSLHVGRASYERTSINEKLANLNLSAYNDVRTGPQDLSFVDREKFCPRETSS